MAKTPEWLGYPEAGSYNAEKKRMQEKALSELSAGAARE